MKTNIYSKIQFIRLGTAFAALMLTAAATADTVIVESYTPPPTSAHNGPPTYNQTVGTWSGSGSSSKSTAPGLAAVKSTYGFAATPTVVITPHLAVAGGTYRVDVTYTVSSNTSTNVLVGLTSPDGALSTNQTDGFRGQAGNIWYTICYITNHAGVTDPALTFTYLSGTLAGTGGRLWTDAYRFVYLGDPCTGVAQISTVNGPLAAGQTFVNVPGVDPTCTNVTVYADSGSGGAFIGSVAVSGATNAVVPVTALVQGNFITATQWKGGVESCHFAPGAGQIVGSGPNSHLRFCLNLVEDATLTGPVGANGSSGLGTYYFLGAEGKIGTGFGTAPNDGVIISPSTCWQTVTFDASQMGEYFWNTTATNPDPNHYAQLDAIAIAIDDLTDNGPYEIFIDNLMSADILVEDFEAAANGASAYAFDQPSFSSTTSGFLLAQAPGTISPNVSVVTTNHADTGTKSLRVMWQWKDLNNSDWVRLISRNKPVLDITKPITFRVLILPVGVTNGDMKISTIPNQTQNSGGSATFSVSATGTGPFAYQWYFNDTNSLSGATGSSYTALNLATNNAGRYTVAVTDGNGCTSTSSANLTVNAVITPVSITISYDGTHVILNWPGSHTLQSAAAVNGTYTDVAGPVLTSPYQVTPTGSAKFFRLRN